MEKILVADDEEGWRISLSEALITMGGFICDTARDYVETLSKIEKNQYDLIVMNRNLVTEAFSGRILEILKNRFFQTPIIIIHGGGSHSLNDQISYLNQICNNYPFVKNVFLKEKSYMSNYLSEFVGEVHKQISESKKTQSSNKTPDCIEAEKLKGEIDIGIICIIQEEFRALVSRFPMRKSIKSPFQSYVFSNIQDEYTNSYNIAMICCSGQGDRNAYHTTTNLIQDLAPKWVFVVGIAGGVPSNDFSLGDVILTNRVMDFSISAINKQGEIQYPLQGYPAHPKIGSLQTQLIAFKDNLKDWNSKDNIGMDVPPVPMTDTSFSGDDSWNQKVKTSLLNSFYPNGIFDDNDYRERIFRFAPTASGNILVKNYKLAESWLNSVRDIQNIEMESPGIFDAVHQSQTNTPVLVIRGISDIVGYNRSDDWKFFAANIASSFTLSLIKSGILQHV